MRVLVAMDSFKGSLTAARACEIVAESIGQVVPKAEIILKPLADGGEGTASAMMAAGNGRWIKETVTGPLPDMQVDAGFVWFEAERMALVEMAAASGLELLSPKLRNPLKTTTYGTGQLINAAVNYGAKRVLLAVGGSATVDGGTGAAAAMGWKFLDEQKNEIIPSGGELIRIAKIISPSQTNRVPIEVLCDVDNPLCGEHGAAKVYAPQKGADEEMIGLLEAALEHLAELIKRQLGQHIKDVPGAGAAGGLAAGAIAFMGARLLSGIEAVMSQNHLGDAVTKADWVITGEGKFDEQSLRGKVISGILRLTKNTTAKVAVLAGQVLLTPREYCRLGVVDAISCMNGTMTLQYAMENGEKLLSQAAKNLALKHLSI